MTRAVRVVVPFWIVCMLQCNEKEGKIRERIRKKVKKKRKQEKGENKKESETRKKGWK